MSLPFTRSVPSGQIWEEASLRNKRLIAENFTPYQLVLGTLTIMYAIRHLDDLLGLGGELPPQRSEDQLTT